MYLSQTACRSVFRDPAAPAGVLISPQASRTARRSVFRDPAVPAVVFTLSLRRDDGAPIDGKSP